MFQSPTVFVIGAGASCGLGFPIGSKLIADIAQLLETELPTFGPPQRLTEVTRAYMQGKPMHAASLNALFGAMQSRLALYSSIDEFIDGQEDDKMTELAKIAIAHVISGGERACDQQYFLPSGFPNQLSKSWYRVLLTQMSSRVRIRSGPHDLASNVTFICFNYDRCLERFLHLGIASLGVPLAEVPSVISQIKIFHPYGTLGPLEWQVGRNKLEFGARPQDIRVTAQSIRTFTEQFEDHVELAAMRSAVENCENLVFLGFGFHPQNVELIAPPGATARRVFATLFNSEIGEQQRVQRIAKERFGRWASPVRTDYNCDGFLESYIRDIAS